MASKRINRFAVRDEFLNLDFPTAATLHEHACHPFMRRLTIEHLEPMVQFYMCIHEDFTWTLPVKTELEKKAMRQWIHTYLDHADLFPLSDSVEVTDVAPSFVPQAHLSDIIIRYKDLAAARRIPAPRVVWLNMVLRADSVFGFEGDEDATLRTVLRGKIVSVLQFSADLRQHAVDRIFIGDGPSKVAEDPFVAGDPKLEEGEIGV